MKPQDFNADCPKCGEGNSCLMDHLYCWRSRNPKCPTWGSYGGEHLHRTCYGCKYIFPVLAKDLSKSEEQTDEEWLNNKVDEAISVSEVEEAERHILLAEDIDWEDPQRLDLPHD